MNSYNNPHKPYSESLQPPQALIQKPSHSKALNPNSPARKASLADPLPRKASQRASQTASGLTFFPWVWGLGWRGQGFSTMRLFVGGSLFVVTYSLTFGGEAARVEIWQYFLSLVVVIAVVMVMATSFYSGSYVCGWSSPAPCVQQLSLMLRC